MKEIINYLAVFGLIISNLFIILTFVHLIRFVMRMKKTAEGFFSSDQLKKIIAQVTRQTKSGNTEDIEMPPQRDPEEEKLFWYMENAPVGKFLGYPECCIKEFCEQPPGVLNMSDTSQSDKDRYQASFYEGEYSGFIPCKKHAEEILQGKITLASLIQGRDKNIPEFPNAYN